MSITRGKIRPFRIAARASQSPRVRRIFRVSALATPPLSVQRYSLEEGLSQQAVNAIVQDSRRLHVVRHRGRTQPLRRLRIPPAAPRSRRRARRCRTAGSPRWSPSEGRIVDRDRWRWRGIPQTRRPASSMRPRSCATRPTCSACARWRATGSAGCGSASRDAGVAIFDARTQRTAAALRHSADASANRCPTTPSSPSCHLRNGDTLVGTASGLDRLTAANLDDHAHRAAAGARRRRPAAAACAR